MMEHLPTDEQILSDLSAYTKDRFADWPRLPWSTYRAIQLLDWMAANIERIARQSQGGPIAERVPDRLPQDSRLWTQPEMP